MKRCSIFLVLMWLSCLLIGVVPYVRAENLLIDRIVAIVNNEVIAQSDVDRVLATIEAELKTMLTDGEELSKKIKETRENIVSQMIEEKLIISEAKRLEIEVEEKIIDARIEQIKSGFPGDEAFEVALDIQGLSLGDLRSRFYDQEIMKMTVDYFVRSQVEVDPKKTKEFYDLNKKEFMQPERAKVKSIVVSIGGAQDEYAALEKAKMVHRRLEKGESFEDMAHAFSDGANADEGGGIGFINKGQLMKEIDEAIFSLKAGEISDILRVSNSFRIFKVEERQAPKELTFSEAQDIIKDLLYKNQFADKFKEFVADLRENAYIVIKND